MTDQGDRAYARPVLRRAAEGVERTLAGGLMGFSEVEILRRNRRPERLPVEAAAALHPEVAAAVERMSAAPAPFLGLDLRRPRVMGIINVTPDSFSDGGHFVSAEAAVVHGVALAEAGADILDVGGESTRPGAREVPEAEELDRVLPVIEGLVAAGIEKPISVDTRKAAVAKAVLAAGARAINDVSAFRFDAGMAEVARGAEAVCLMHALGDPATMQESPRYGDVLLDVYDFLERAVAGAERTGIPRIRVALDPGIGFGKTQEHNLALLRGLALFHGLGCPILLGVSRKRFIGTLGRQPQAARRMPGSIAAGLAGLARGVQILRVHDVAETVQAVRVWQAIQGSD